MAGASEVQCPEDKCTDMLQGAPSEHLKTMLEKLSAIGKGKETGMPLTLSLLTCQAIKDELRFPILKALGVRSGWPMTINFETIPSQIIEMKDEIHVFLKNEIVLGSSSSWCTFVNDVARRADMSLANFSASNEVSRFTVAGIGDNRHAG